MTPATIIVPGLIALAVAALSHQASAGGDSNCRTCREWACQEPFTIKQVQGALREKGENIKPDGSFGASTENALERFAEKNDITDTGPRNLSLLKALFSNDEYDEIRRRIYSAWVC